LHLDCLRWLSELEDGDDCGKRLLAFGNECSSVAVNIAEDFGIKLIDAGLYGFESRGKPFLVSFLKIGRRVSVRLQAMNGLSMMTS